MSIVIQSENLSKKYLIRHETRGGYTALRDVISSSAQQAFKNIKQTICRPFSKNASHQNSPSSEEFWALKDVSFEIKQGEVVGIIGRNGAGKSTLLKILSRITEPTTGRVKIKGRVASLLEVGTGFHPELTGRENIFLNGAILGMTKAEIKRKFDEIVAFAEIDKFLDTPVKRYSSGMYVRLAFAVAAHLEPEILLVDEVLAVGDAAFQKKCLGKMGDVAKEGRTVLFISHNMGAIENLCNTGFILDKGKVTLIGGADEAIRHYLDSFAENQQADLSTRFDRKGDGNVRLTQLEFKDKDNTTSGAFSIGADIFFELKYTSSCEVRNPRVILGIYDQMALGVTRLDTEVTSGLPLLLPKAGKIVCHARNISLTPGRYMINVAFFSSGTMEDYLAGAAYFDIIGSDYYNTGKIFNEGDAKLTKVLFKHDWRYLP